MKKFNLILAIFVFTGVISFTSILSASNDNMEEVLPHEDYLSQQIKIQHNRFLEDGFLFERQELQTTVDQKNIKIVLSRSSKESGMLKKEEITLDIKCSLDLTDEESVCHAPQSYSVSFSVITYPVPGQSSSGGG